MGKFNKICDQLFEERKFAEERAYIEKKMRSPFYFLVRMSAMEHYVRVCMALDDLPMAARYIDTLRNGGGKGWKYKTAYPYILIKLDEGDLQTARAEYSEFKRDCAQAEIYQTEIEILTAILSRLLTARNSAPLPEAAVESSYPVISRILGRHYEEQATQSDTEWI